RPTCSPGVAMPTGSSVRPPTSTRTSRWPPATSAPVREGRSERKRGRGGERERGRQDADCLPLSRSPPLPLPSGGLASPDDAQPLPQAQPRLRRVQADQTLQGADVVDLAGLEQQRAPPGVPLRNADDVRRPRLARVELVGDADGLAGGDAGGILV